MVLMLFIVEMRMIRIPFAGGMGGPWDGFFGSFAS
jgi:hypothetical protein